MFLQLGFAHIARLNRRKRNAVRGCVRSTIIIVSVAALPPIVYIIRLGRLGDLHGCITGLITRIMMLRATTAVFFVLFCIFRTHGTHLLSSFFWTSRGHRCRPFSPPVLAFDFLSRIGFSNPAARRFFIECCYLTLSRFPRINLCTRKVPKNLYEYALEGIRTHDTDLYQARG